MIFEVIHFDQVYGSSKHELGPVNQVSYLIKVCILLTLMALNKYISEYLTGSKLV